MFVDIATGKNSIYKNFLSFDSEEDSQTANPDLPLSSSVNEVVLMRLSEH